MTVRENLEMGAFVRTDRKSQAYADDLARVFDLFPRLSERISQPAGKLSGGEQQMLAIGRCRWPVPGWCCWMNRPWVWRDADPAYLLGDQ